jgi:hypothetical protein
VSIAFVKNSAPIRIALTELHITLIYKVIYFWRWHIAAFFDVFEVFQLGSPSVDRKPAQLLGPIISQAG